MFVEYLAKIFSILWVNVSFFAVQTDGSTDSANLEENSSFCSRPDASGEMSQSDKIEHFDLGVWQTFMSL